MTTTRPGYIWSGTEWVAIGQEAAVAPVSYQATAPSSPATGDIWIDSDDEVPGITSSLNYRWRRIATGGETSLSGNDSSGLPLAYNPGYEQVYINGVLQYRGDDYTATTGNTITGLTALVVNDTIEVLSFVTAPIGDTYTQAASDAKFANMTTTPISGFRNAIINGDFRVWQRGTSFSIGPAVTLFTADRYSVFNNATSTPVTVSQQAFTPGNQIPGHESANFFRCTMSGYSSSAVFIGQKIEDVRTFAGQTVTVSYWAKSSVNMSLSLDYVQWFGASGSSLVNASLATASTTTSWQRFSHTLNVPSISGKTIGAGSSFEIRFLMSANGSLDIWGVQVEKGTIATPFEQRPIGTELDLCYRYFQVVGSGMVGRWGSQRSAEVFVQFRTTMRTNPTPSVQSTGQFFNVGIAGTAQVAFTISSSVLWPKGGQVITNLTSVDVGGSVPNTDAITTDCIGMSAEL
jgi:hypothetical protein